MRAAASFDPQADLDTAGTLVASAAGPWVEVAGSRALLLSAPHAVEQRRDGKRKRAESQTGPLAVWLVRRHGAAAQARRRCAGDGRTAGRRPELG